MRQLRKHRAPPLRCQGRYFHLQRNKKPSILSKEATSPCQGHLNCVTFLINFGVNIWDLDIDLHSAKVLGLGKRMKEIEILWSSKKGWESGHDHHHHYYRHHRHRHRQDLAAINSREDILKYLDAAGAQQEAANSKQAKSLQVREKSPRKRTHSLFIGEGKKRSGETSKKLPEDPEKARQGGDVLECFNVYV